MATIPKSKLSVSNIILLIVCLAVIATVLLLNIFNTRTLAQLRSYVHSLTNQNSQAEVLRNTTKELLEAENAYRLYLTTKDTLYSNKYLSHIVTCVNDLRALKTSDDSGGINLIIAGIEKKIQIADALDIMDRVADSVFKRTTTAQAANAYINPFWFRLSNTSILKGYDSLMKVAEMPVRTGQGKNGFLKKLGDIFESQAQAVTDQSSVTTGQYTWAPGQDPAQLEVDAYYAKRTGIYMLPGLIDKLESQLAQVNLVLEYQVSDQLKKSLGLEEAYDKANEDKILERAKEAKQMVQGLTWGSYVVILCIIVLLVINIRRSMKYESEIIEAREKAEKLVMTKSRFLSNMSHEIRSPLTSIIGFTEQLDNSEIDLEKKRYLNAIRTSSDHLLTTVNDILDFSKLDAGKLSLERKPFNVKKVVEEVLYAFSVAAQKKNILLHPDVQVEETLLVIGDAFRLKQILFNLTSNAIKFTEQGKVRIGVKSISRTDKEIVLKMDVQDSGVGIPSDQLEFIFEEFAQATNTKTGGRRAIRGTGLGLAICKMLTELQGGKISVKSELNVGSVFSLTIPYEIEQQVKNTPAEDAADSAGAPGQKTFAGMKALIVEDNDMNILLLKLLMKKIQLDYDVAKDGEEAMRLFGAGIYDIVLTDINVPKLTGDQIAGLIRKDPDFRKSAVPIIALTASIIGDNTEHYFRMGINEMLIKPFKEVEFKKVLNHYLLKENGMS